MRTEIIKEGVLNDDTIYIAEENKFFKGKYKAIIEYYTFLNSWSNRRNIRRFKTLENAYKFIEKNLKQS